MTPDPSSSRDADEFQLDDDPLALTEQEAQIAAEQQAEAAFWDDMNAARDAMEARASRHEYIGLASGLITPTFAASCKCGWRGVAHVHRSTIVAKEEWEAHRQAAEQGDE